MTRTTFFFSLAVGMFLWGCSGESPTEPGSEDGVLYNVAGMATSAGYGGNGKPATQARLYYPQDAIVVSGELYIVDWNNHVIRKVDAEGIISRAMGSGAHGDDTDGPILEVNLNHPDNMAVGPDGNFYICGWHNWKIKKVDRTTGYVSSAVGTDNGYAGDGGPATEARISLPSSIVWDFAGNMYITDQGNTRIRKVDAETGIITTFAGGGKGYAEGVGGEARFAWPTGTDSFPGGKMDISADGESFYLADTENNRIRKIDIATGTVTTIAGTGVAGYTGDGGSALLATLDFPTDVTCTPDDDLYVADAVNHVIRKIDRNGIITTVVGMGAAGYSPDATSARSARLNRPSGVHWDEPTQTLYVVDTFNHQVKKVRLPS